MTARFCLFSFFLSASLFTATVFAQPFYCPTTYQYVDIGDTEKEVLQKCGSPINIERNPEHMMKVSNIQQWYYKVRANLVSRERNVFAFVPRPGDSGFDDATVNLIFTIKDDEVFKLEVGGQEVASTTLCGAVSTALTSVNVGDAADVVLSECGRPELVNRTTLTEPTGVEEVTVWTYDFGRYQSKAKFRFTNGVLRSVTQE